MTKNKDRLPAPSLLVLDGFQFGACTNGKRPETDLRNELLVPSLNYRQLNTALNGVEGSYGSSFHFQGPTALQFRSPLGSVQLAKVADFPSLCAEAPEITILSPT